MDENKRQSLQRKLVLNPGRSLLSDGQLEHFLSGKAFSAVFSPTVREDLKGNWLQFVDKPVTIVRNMVSCPVFFEGRYHGQHRFTIVNGPEGWGPEEDFTGLKMLDQEYEDPDFDPWYIYRITYTDINVARKAMADSIQPDQMPLIVVREYQQERDDYVMEVLGKPKPALIEKMTWKKEWRRSINWSVLYERD